MLRTSRGRGSDYEVGYECAHDSGRGRGAASPARPKTVGTLCVGGAGGVSAPFCRRLPRLGTDLQTT